MAWSEDIVIPTSEITVFSPEHGLVITKKVTPPTPQLGQRPSLTRLHGHGALQGQHLGHVVGAVGDEELKVLQPEDIGGEPEHGHGHQGRQGDEEAPLEPASHPHGPARPKKMVRASCSAVIYSNS